METNKKKIIFKIIEVEPWLNLMPGGEPKFHLAGKADIYSKTELSDFNGLFKSINISQDQVQLYTFKPLVNLLTDEINDEELFVYNIKFYTETGLRINTGMDSDKNIDVEFIFSEDLNMNSIPLTDIKLEKAY